MIDSLMYRLKVRVLKTRRGNLFWRHLTARNGTPVGNYADLPSYIRQYAGGKSFTDIGCMWGVNGDYAFAAEAAGVIKGRSAGFGFALTPPYEGHIRVL